MQEGPIFAGQWALFKRYPAQWLRGSAVGTLIGALPGAGCDIAAWISYGISKRFSKEPEKFGTGHVEGIVESGAANNAAVSGTWIPALVFGIPGDSITAIVIGVLYLKNLNPGPMIFQDQPELVTAIFIVFFLSNIIMVPFGWLAIKSSVHILRVPRSVLMPIIMMFCIVGAFAITNSPFAVLIMLAFGVLGFLMEENGFPVAPGDPRDRARPDAGGQFLQLDDQGGRQFHRVLPAPDRRLSRPRDDRDMGRDDLVLLARRQVPAPAGPSRQ